MKIAASNLSIVPFRAEASHRSEMVSQVLFGEVFEILQEDVDFVKVRLLSVNYEGWIQRNQFGSVIDKEQDTTMIVGIHGATAVSVKHRVNLVHGTVITGDTMRIGEEVFTIEGDLRKVSLADFDTEFEYLVSHYNNSPYLWGGRSIYGIDCSGFSQIVYRHFGISLPRDAWQQAEKGEVVDFQSEIRKGDLAFFDNEAGKITHVGVMINNETIIHASGRIRVDKMDNEGIFNAELNKYTHRLRIVKRYI